MTVKSITLVPRSGFPRYGVLVRMVIVEPYAFKFRVQGQTIQLHIPGDYSFVLTALHTTDLLLVPSMVGTSKFVCTQYCV
jgi:hypothetical protein